jgi:hypothetical protein
MTPVEGAGNGVCPKVGSRFRTLPAIIPFHLGHYAAAYRTGIEVAMEARVTPTRPELASNLSNRACPDTERIADPFSLLPSGPSRL